MNNVKQDNKNRKVNNFLAVIVFRKVSDQLRQDECHIKQSLKNICTLERRQLFELVDEKPTEKHFLKASRKKSCQNVNRDTEGGRQIALGSYIAQARRAESRLNCRGVGELKNNQLGHRNNQKRDNGKERSVFYRRNEFFFFLAYTEVF